MLFFLLVTSIEKIVFFIEFSWSCIFGINSPRGCTHKALAKMGLNKPLKDQDDFLSKKKNDEDDSLLLVLVVSSSGDNEVMIIHSSGNKDLHVKEMENKHHFSTCAISHSK